MLRSVFVFCTVLRVFKIRGPLRLAVRTTPFQGAEMGSIPIGGTMCLFLFVMGIVGSPLEQFEIVVAPFRFFQFLIVLFLSTALFYSRLLSFLQR